MCVEQKPNANSWLQREQHNLNDADLIRFRLIQNQPVALSDCSALISDHFLAPPLINMNALQFCAMC